MIKKQRRKTPTVKIGSVAIGSNHPVVIQSMTNTNTADIEGTVEQIILLAEAGSELVRITVNNKQAAAAVPAIAEKLAGRCCTIPIIGDFHYNGHLLLREFPECARSLAKYRINPGNVGVGRQHDDNFRQMIDIAMKYDKPIRIGVNGGSLDQPLLARMLDQNVRSSRPLDPDRVVAQAMIASALQSARQAEVYGLAHDRIILSVKVAALQDLVRTNDDLASQCDYPLHLGLTEAGMGLQGTVASAAALAIVLQHGIGDTIRVSLTPAPGSDRGDEVRICRQVLQSLGLRHFAPQVTACPGCGRTTSARFQELADRIQHHLATQMKTWKTQYPGVECLNVAVMGCVVNGPGESKQADIGISLPGAGEEPKAPVYVNGKLFKIIQGENMIQEFQSILDDYVARRFGRQAS